MAYLILTKEQADQVRGRHGLYSELQPVLLPDGKYALPEECKNDPDLAEVKGNLEVVTEIKSILQLPEAGSNEPVYADTIYYYSDPDDIESAAQNSGMVICVQDHNRTIYRPQETPALFSFYRENTDDLEWIENEHVQLGWKRWYSGTQYEVIQAHQTLSTWTPVVTLGTLWKSLSTSSEWAVGIAYSVNDEVTYLGNTYICLQAHTSQIGWNPVSVPALWQLQ